MIDPFDLIDFKINPNRTCVVTYKICFGESKTQDLHLVRTLNEKETERLVRRLSEFVDSYNKG